MNLDQRGPLPRTLGSAPGLGLPGATDLRIGQSVSQNVKMGDGDTDWLDGIAQAELVRSGEVNPNHRLA